MAEDSDEEWLRELLGLSDQDTEIQGCRPHGSPAFQQIAEAKVLPKLVMLHMPGARCRVASRNFWKTYVPKSLHDVPGLETAMNDILSHPEVQLQVHSSAVLASKLLSHANQVIESVAAHTEFKIGLTRSPRHRWANRDYGYVLEGSWSSMLVICIFEHSESAAMMEAALIYIWGSNPRCLNEAGGGESASKEPGPYFIYIVQS